MCCGGVAQVDGDAFVRSAPRGEGEEREREQRAMEPAPRGRAGRAGAVPRSALRFHGAKAGGGQRWQAGPARRRPGSCGAFCTRREEAEARPGRSRRGQPSRSPRRPGANPAGALGTPGAARVGPAPFPLPRPEGSSRPRLPRRPPGRRPRCPWETPAGEANPAPHLLLCPVSLRFPLIPLRLCLVEFPKRLPSTAVQKSHLSSAVFKAVVNKF